MKNSYNFKTNKRISTNLKIIALAQTAFIMLTSCSNINEIPSNTLEDYTSSIATSETSDSMPTETYIEASYDFHWGQQECEDFDKVITDKYNIHLTQYVHFFGFTNELSIEFTKFVNEHFEKDYNYVPFSEANYFRSYVSNTSYDYYHRYRDDYDVFCHYYLADSSVNGAFSSELVISYLIQNNITFGKPIPIEYLKNFYGENVYLSADPDNVFDNYYRVGYYGDNYDYNAEELFIACICYNNAISTLTFSEGNPTKDLLTTDPEFADQAKETIEIFNPYFVQKYGEGCIQFGEVPTEETFQVMFPDKEMYDFSNIPGAVMNDPQLKGSSKNQHIVGEYDGQVVGFGYYNQDEEYDIDLSRGHRM